MECTVVVDDCAAVAVTGGPISVRTKDTSVGPRNFLVNYGHLAAGLPRPLADRELDWIETLVSIFAIDLACPRGSGDLGWARSIVGYLPVRDPTFWNAQAQKIQSIFSDFTFDRLQLHFEQSGDPEPPPRQKRNPFVDHDSVSLISGGVDSFVGALELLANGQQPLGVSHVAAGATSHAQAEVETAIRTRFADFTRVAISASKRGASFPNPEPSQRSRSLMFLGAASLVAAVGGSNDVYINENGVMAINIPMTAARAGSLTTHTASPLILARIQELAREVLDAPISIHNVLLGKTKPEVVSLGVRHGGAEELLETVSCWSIGRTWQHCGWCVPCLMRRISFEKSGLQDVEYAEDAFNDSAVLQNEFAVDNLTHLVLLVRDIRHSSDLQLQINYPELLNGGDHLSLSETIDLHRRWAAEADQVISGTPVVARLL